MPSHLARNGIEFRIWGRFALFTDPLTKIGGEKCSYHVPTYEALKGIVKSIYWKPTIIWVIDEVRVMKRIQTQTKGTKPLEFSGGNTLAIYTFLSDVEYQVRAHFEQNVHRPELEADWIPAKHFEIAQRSLSRGGRQDVFLGTRDCQGYVEPCEFGSGPGYFDDQSELSFGMMFHGFDYPDETGQSELVARFWRSVMFNGVIRFERAEQCTIRKPLRVMLPKRFDPKKNLKSAGIEASGQGD